MGKAQRRLWRSVALAVGAVLLAASAWAQSKADEEAEGAPQILTSDLAQEQEVREERMTVNFVIVGSAPITRVLINGEPQALVEGDTALVSKELRFESAVNTVRVSATDSAGRTREKVFVVRRGGAAAAEVVTNFSLEARYEVDGNPTNDLSSPVPIQGLTLQGVVKDSEQADTRATVRGSGSVSQGRWTGFGGALTQTYTKEVNKGLALQMVYLGGSARFQMTGASDFLLSYIFTNLGVGGHDYVNIHTVTPLVEFRSEDRDGAYRHQLAMDLSYKDFAQADQKAGADYALRWNYRSLDAERQDSFESVTAYGTNTEGKEVTDFTYIGWDADWKNRWDVGLRFDAGFGLQMRNFAQDKQPLTKQLYGDTRVDSLIRASTAIGWGFLGTWSAMLNYRYLADISNKAPYVRPIYGLIVGGAF
jgi:hypothetical protein